MLALEEQADDDFEMVQRGLAVAIINHEFAASITAIFSHIFNRLPNSRFPRRPFRPTQILKIPNDPSPIFGHSAHLPGACSRRGHSIPAPPNLSSTRKMRVLAAHWTKTGAAGPASCRAQVSAALG
jgi:hypothetical protein